MDAIFFDSLLAIAEECLIAISNDPALKQSILGKCQNADDWLQVRLGQVNKRTLRDAIELAIATSTVRDENTMLDIIATISALYACDQVERGADVGGALLKKFGQEVFPHIDIKELRFAKSINEAAFEICLKVAKEKFPEIMSDYDFKRLSPEEIRSSWAATSCIGIHGVGWMILNYGLDLIQAIRKIVRFS